MIHDDAALGEQLFHVAVGQAVAQVPAHRDRDHLTRQPVPVFMTALTALVPLVMVMVLVLVLVWSLPLSKWVRVVFWVARACCHAPFRSGR